MGVPGGVGLGLEEGVEVPETTLDPLVCWHLLETHLAEDLPELRTDLEEGVEVPSVDLFTYSLEVVGLELRGGE